MTAHATCHLARGLIRWQGRRHDPPAGTPRAQALSDHLRWVHAMLRRDLASVRELATSVAAEGAPVPEVRAGLAALETRGPLFQLRANCLGYCQLLHSHHGAEDDGAVPRRTPVGAAPARGRGPARGRPPRGRVRCWPRSRRSPDDLDRECGPPAHSSKRSTACRSELLEHLAFEEETIGPVLDSWDGWPEPDADELH